MAGTKNTSSKRTSSSSKKSWKDEKRQREKVKAFRLSEDEVTSFLANAEAANLTGGDYFRVRCCSAKPLRKQTIRKLDEKMLAKILGELGAWGRNLNQIAHAMNIATKEPTYSPSYAASRLKQYEADIAELQKTLSECRMMIRETLLGRDING